MKSIAIVCALFILRPAAEAATYPDLTALRGEWEYRTFSHTIRMNFITDSTMIFERWDATYSILPGKLRIRNDDGIREYPYKIERDRLLIELTQGSITELRHSSQGELEERLEGSFETTVDSLKGYMRLDFFDDNSFSSFALDLGDTLLAGRYRIEGTQLILSYDDGSIDTADVGSNGGNGEFGRIVYGEEFYHRPNIQTHDAYVQAADILPVCILIPSPPPPPPVVIIPAPVVQPPPASAPPSEKPKVRDFGSTRGGRQR